MLDQERSAGIHRLLWQGPLLFQGANDPLYYSPLLNAFCKDAVPANAPHGGFLCEEMGLGKTVEVMALVLANPAPNPMPKIDLEGAKLRSRGTLVICPVSLVGQWAAEAQSKIEADIKIYQYHGSGRKREAKFLADQDVVVTTYATLSSDFGSRSKRALDGWSRKDSPLHRVFWHRVVLDESHNVKSLKAGHSQACCELKSLNRWCATGTPCGTSVQDLMGQLAFLKLAPLSNPTIFKKYFTALFERVADYRFHQTGSQMLSLLKACTIRHTKSQKIGGQTVLTLPKRTDIDVKIVLTPSERQLYTKAEQRAKSYYRGVQQQGDNAIARATFSLYSALLPLRQLCAGGKMDLAKLNASGAAPGPGGGGDEAPARLRVSERCAPDDACCICQDVFERPVETPCRHWYCYDCITTFKQSQLGNNGCPTCRQPFELEDLAEGAPKAQPLMLTAAAFDEADEEPEAAASAADEGMVTSKLQTLLDDLRKTRADDPTAKCLIFTQFNTSIEWLKGELTKEGVDYRTITGSMTMKQRTKSIQLFQNDPPTTVFLLSIRAGAVGINLTAANVVYMMEPCLNPALEEQAVGRVHRMGQTRPVTVKRLFVEDSVEERIAKVVKDRCRTAASADGASDVAGPSRGRRPLSDTSTTAGALKADKQQLKTAEWAYLFGA